MLFMLSTPAYAFSFRALEVVGSIISNKQQTVFVRYYGLWYALRVNDVLDGARVISIDRKKACLTKQGVSFNIYYFLYKPVDKDQDLEVDEEEEDWEYEEDPFY
jgi:NADPH-dependent 2,4-dienoyl-CoA reductase/sulfur reductase-like enzyme